jgi:hypothetical protein
MPTTIDGPFYAKRICDVYPGDWYLSGWSQTRLEPTYLPTTDGALIWTNADKLERWKRSHNAFDWSSERLEYEPCPEPNDRGGDRFRRLNRRRPTRAP